MAMIGWILVYLARAIELVRLWCGSAVIDTPLRRWTTRRLASQAILLTPLGSALLKPTKWMRPVSTWLIRRANRYLPSLPYGVGFLYRLYPWR